MEALRKSTALLDPAALPERLSGHRIATEIGSGGMGRVLLATDEALGRKVAIKTLAPRYADNPVLRARFMAEARAMARLSHPNIVRIYSLGPADEPPHFVMEYVEGAPLQRAALPLAFEQRAELMRKVALAAHFLHERGIVHRDLKPCNILVGPDLEPKLLDFGLALDQGSPERFSSAGDAPGTPEYFSPEQARGVQGLDARSDVFSLGAILYELLTGELPFHGDNKASLLRSISEEDPALPRRRDPKIPIDLQNICLKALEKDLAQRYRSARDMADDLGRFLAREPVLAEPGAYSRLIGGQVSEHLHDLEGLAPRPDRLQRGVRGTPQALRTAAGARRRLDTFGPSADASAGHAVPGRVDSGRGGGVADVLSLRQPGGRPQDRDSLGGARPTAWMGVRTWRRGYCRVSIAYLLACCLVVPATALVTLEEARLFTGFTRGDVDLELFQRLKLTLHATNAQFWWALLSALPVCWWLRRFTRAPVFALMCADNGGAVLDGDATAARGAGVSRSRSRAVLLLPDSLRGGVYDRRALLERLKLPDDSRYFYPFAVAFTWAALSGLATFHEPWAHWLRRASRGPTGKSSTCSWRTPPHTSSWTASATAAPLFRRCGWSARRSAS